MFNTKVLLWQSNTILICSNCDTLKITYRYPKNNLNTKRPLEGYPFHTTRKFNIVLCPAVLNWYPNDKSNFIPLYTIFSVIIIDNTKILMLLNSKIKEL
jgi:hypothetical protein